MKKITSLFLIFILIGSALYAQQSTQNDVRFSVQFYDRRIYYPGSSESDPIFVKFSITNDSVSTFRFKLADDRIYSVDFTVTSTKNRNLDHSLEWQRRRNSNRKVYFREVSLEPGETFSFIENLKDYIDIASPGVYVLQALFFPELKQSASNSELHYLSNRLNLEIKPALGPAAGGTLPASEANGDILEALPISPDDVIKYILTARQKSRWQQFFLYLDLARMIQLDSSRGKRYNAESEAGRITLLENYKQELMQNRIEKDIVAIPSDFEIERTTYTANEAEVRVIEWFAYTGFKEKKRYVYYLSSRNGVWLVHDYTVENLGTE